MNENHDRPSGRRRGLRTLVAIAAAGALLLAGCGDDDDEPTTQDTTEDTAEDGGGEDVLGPVDRAEGEPVKIGFITDGKNAATDQSMELDVTDAVVAYLNEHKGGLGGRPIEPVKCEAKLDPAKGTDCANQLVEQDVVAVVVGTTGVVDAVWQPLHDAGIATFFYAAGGQITKDPETTFTLSDPTAGTVGTPAGVAKSEGVDKVTAIVIDVPAALPSYQGEGLKAWKDAGLELDLIRVAPGTADMTPQLQKLASGDPGVVHVLGNDSFCISAFQALIALNVEAPVTTISTCMSDATREAIPGDFFEGMRMTAVAPIGDEGEKTALIRAVADEYADSPFDLSRTAPFGTFMAWNAFHAAAHEVEGEITADSIIAAIKAAPAQEIPGSGGLKFRCNGKAHPASPASCVRGTLVTTLDAEGNATDYEVVGLSDIPD
jgi:branched-chain amino acid transport system substrate-binding protein